MIAPWPESDARRRDPRIEAQFARFQEVLRAVRDIRGRQNVPPKTKIDFAVRCDAETAELLRADGAVLRVDGRRPGDRLGPGRSQPRRWRPTSACPASKCSSTWPG